VHLLSILSHGGWRATFEHTESVGGCNYLAENPNLGRGVVSTQLINGANVAEIAKARSGRYGKKSSIALATAEAGVYYYYQSNPPVALH
jgi:hypothetical protein